MQAARHDSGKSTESVHLFRQPYFFLGRAEILPLSHLCFCRRIARLSIR